MAVAHRGGGAYFAIEQRGVAIPNFTVHDSVLIAGDWIDARVGWGGGVSHGQHCHLDTPHSISVVIIHTKYNKRGLNGSTVHG